MSGATLTLTPPEGAARGDVRGGRAAEFLLTGGGTLVLFPLAWLLRVALVLDDAELQALTDASAPRIDDYPYGTAGVAQRERKIAGGR